MNPIILCLPIALRPFVPTCLLVCKLKTRKGEPIAIGQFASNLSNFRILSLAREEGLLFHQLRSNLN